LAAIVTRPSRTATQSADSGYLRRAECSDRGQSRIITATQAATEQYAMTNHTLAKNGTLAMSGALRAHQVALTGDNRARCARRQRAQPPAGGHFSCFA
jgi:hypothetical protein